MAKVSPLLRSFNAGEWSTLMGGRTDLDKYGASCLKMFNALPSPEGAAIFRMGTAFVVPAAGTETGLGPSALLPYQFSSLQSCILEFSDGQLRFITEDGLTVNESDGIEGLGSNGGFVQLNLSGMPSALSVGQEVALQNFPNSYGLNGLVGTIDIVAGTTITLSILFPATAVAGTIAASLLRVYVVATPYTNVSVLQAIRYAQKNDVMYIFCPGYPVQKLSRLGSTNWTIAPVVFQDGPWLDVNYEDNVCEPTGTGATPILNFLVTQTDDNFVPLAGAAPYTQHASVTWNTAAATTLNGYQITLPPSDSTTVGDFVYSQKDMEPVTWILYGSNDNVTFVKIDSQTNYVDYVSECSDWFPVYSTIPYIYYKMNISATYTAAPIPAVLNFVLTTSKEDTPFDVDFTNTTNINFGAGFVSTDVGRLLRIQREDSVWAAFEILGVNSPTQVAVAPQFAPLPDGTSTTFWRLGLYGETNGYPTCGCFFQSRLWMGGVANYPDTLVGSEVAGYENMQPDDPRGGTITDSDAINITIESRSQVLWMTSDDRGLVLGTAAGEWVVQAAGYSSNATTAGITPTNVLAKNPTKRGSAPSDAVGIGHQTIFVQRAGRQIYESAYDFTIDSYTTTSLSTEATHLGVPSIIRLAYAAEPYSTLWALRSDGVLLSLTYLEEDQVSGWAQHDVGGVVESIAVIPSPDNQQDTLWMVVRRTVNGVQVRYIERMLRLWDFDMTNLDAAYMDCCSATTATGNTLVGGFPQLAGQPVYGLIDGVTPFGPVTVAGDGTLELPVAPTIQAIIGFGMTAEVITQRLEAGSQLGTAQGKLKRIDRIMARLWATGSGNIALAPSLNSPSPDVQTLIFSNDYGCSDPENTLHDFDFDFKSASDFDTNASISLTRGVMDVLPFNVICLVLWTNVEDGV